MKFLCAMIFPSLLSFASFFGNSTAFANGLNYKTCKIDSTLECPKADNYYCLDNNKNDIDCRSTEAKIRICVYGNDNPFIPAAGSCGKKMLVESDVTICGKFKDNGDSFQIIDGKLNPYVDGSNNGPHDPNGIQDKIFADKPHGKSYCVTGTVQAFNRGRKIAFEFISLTDAYRK